MDANDFPIHFLVPIALLITNYFCGQQRGQILHYLLGLDIPEGQPQHIDGKKYMITLVVSFTILWAAVLHLNRRRRLQREVRHLPNRRRAITASSSSTMMDSNELERWQRAKTALEDELKSLADFCPAGKERKGQVKTSRPFLPVELRDACYTSVRADKQRLCDLLIGGTDEELVSFIGNNGLHPRDYGFDLHNTVAFLTQHAFTLNTRLQAALASS